MTSSPDVIVIGAGVIGLAVARELALRGYSVTIVERGSPGREASWAAAGMLSPLGEAVGSPGMRSLAEASLDRWPAFARAILDDTGVDVEYRTPGALHVAFDDQELHGLHALRARADERAGVSVLDAAAARDLEPAVARDVKAGLFIARDHRVNNRRLGQALWASSVGAGVECRLGVAVIEVVLEQSKGTRRFSRVRLADSPDLAGGAVVIAAGAWSATLGGLPSPVPVRPVRGQMLAVSSAHGAGPRLERVLVGAGCYLVPREDGQILIGATVEDAGFRPGPTPAGIASLISAAGRLAPLLTELPVTETWAGFRPGTPDDLPILGRDPRAENVYLATGHYRNGILLTPVTAEVIADCIEDREPVLPLEPFSTARFDDASSRG